MKLLKLRTCVLCLAVIMAAAALNSKSAHAAPGHNQITGIISDISTQEPVAGANVLVIGSYAGAHSNAEGEFTIGSLANGTYSLQVSHIGYSTVRIDSVIVSDSEMVHQSIRLTPRVIVVKSMTVTPGRFNFMGPEPVIQQTMSQQQIATTPQLGDDFFRAVTRLPGMSGNDFSARFTVRGGEYDEVLVTLDGLRIYEPFHLKDIDGGAMSVIDVAAVESIDLMTGGFPANYGDKLSAAFSIKSRNVPADKNRISAGVSLSNAHAFTEGTFDNNRGSWLVSARRGYIDYVLKLVDANENVKPTYYDMFGKLRYVLGKKNILAAHVLHASDDLTYKGEDYEAGDTLITSYGNSYVWLTLWTELHPKLMIETVASTGKVNHLRTGHFLDESIRMPEYVAHDDEDFRFVALNTDWEFELSDEVIFEAGVEVQRQWADYNYLSEDFEYTYRPAPNGYTVELDGVDTTKTLLDIAGTRVGSFVTGRLRLANPLVAELGFRYDRAAYAGDDIFSPRAALAYELHDRTTLRFGWGHYYQIEGVDEIAVGDGETGFYPAQKAEHRVVGLEHQFESGVQLRVEAYQKRYSDLRIDYRNSFDAIQEFPEREFDRAAIYREKGEARGIELYLKNDTGRKLSWWASYAIAKGEDSVHHIAFPQDNTEGFYNTVIPKLQDQRHTLYFDLHYRPTGRWQISSAFQYHSGWPFTDAYLASRVTDDGISYWVQADEIWGARHEAFYRLDMRINRYFPLAKGRITAFVEVLNVLGRKNVRGYDFFLGYDGRNYYVGKEAETWLGRLPSFGVSYEVEF